MAPERLESICGFGSEASKLQDNVIKQAAQSSASSMAVGSKYGSPLVAGLAKCNLGTSKVQRIFQTGTPAFEVHGRMDGVNEPTFLTYLVSKISRLNQVRFPAQLP